CFPLILRTHLTDRMERTATSLSPTFRLKGARITMHQCPNCGVTLGFPLSHCHGGRCPKCHYKPGDHDKTKWVREPRYLVEVEKALRAAGFTDEKFIKEAKLRMQVKHDGRER